MGGRGALPYASRGVGYRVRRLFFILNFVPPESELHTPPSVSGGHILNCHSPHTLKLPSGIQVGINDLKSLALLTAEC